MEFGINGACCYAELAVSSRRDGWVRFTRRVRRPRRVTGA